MTVLSRSRPSELEASYIRARLLGQRLLIRLTCTFSALVAGFRSAEQTMADLWHPAQPIALGFVLATSVVLVLIVWTRAFERLYLPVANAVVPVRSVVAAAFIAGAAAHGQQEMLMFLPLMIVGPFFFLGLGWRVALCSGVLTFLSFAPAAVAFGLELPVVLRVGALLILAVVASAIGARHLDSLARKGFLESNRISELALKDGLTGLNNRRVFDEQLAKLWRQAVEHADRLAILLIDVDHFKTFNDRHGHQAGDRALRRVAQTLERFVERPLDVVARYGGEEFAVILYDAGVLEAQALAEKMRRAVSGADTGSREPGRSAGVTISVGIGFVEPSSDRQPLGALQLADQALYEAKQRGRNRVVLMDQTAHDLLETGIFAPGSLAREA